MKKQLQNTLNKLSHLISKDSSKQKNNDRIVHVLTERILNEHTITQGLSFKEKEAKAVFLADDIFYYFNELHGREPGSKKRLITVLLHNFDSRNKIEDIIFSLLRDKHIHKRYIPE